MSASSEPRVLSGDVVPRGALCSFIAKKAAGEPEQEEVGCPGRQDKQDMGGRRGPSTACFGDQNTLNTRAGLPALTLLMKSWEPQPVQPVSLFQSVMTESGEMAERF